MSQTNECAPINDNLKTIVSSNRSGKKVYRMKDAHLSGYIKVIKDHKPRPFKA